MIDNFFVFLIDYEIITYIHLQLDILCIHTHPHTHTYTHFKKIYIIIYVYNYVILNPELVPSPIKSDMCHFKYFL